MGDVIYRSVRIRIRSAGFGWADDLGIHKGKRGVEVDVLDSRIKGCMNVWIA